MTIKTFVDGFSGSTFMLTVSNHPDPYLRGIKLLGPDYFSSSTYRDDQ